MTATSAPARSAARHAPPGLAAARLLRLELRHNAMLWMMPVAIALFWFTAERKTIAAPPLWNLRAAGMQTAARCWRSQAPSLAPPRGWGRGKPAAAPPTW